MASAIESIAFDRVLGGFLRSWRGEPDDAIERLARAISPIGSRSTDRKISPRSRAACEAQGCRNDRIDLALVASRTREYRRARLGCGESWMRSCRVVALLACLSLAACEAQRAQLAADAQTVMLGRTKEQVLACMGQPANKTAEGAAEVWSYRSGDGSIEAKQSTGEGWVPGARSQSSCTINMTMVGGRVTKMSYVGPTGELVMPNHQCAFALEDCIPH